MSWYYQSLFVYTYFSSIYPIWVKYYEKRRVLMIEFCCPNLEKKRESKIYFFSDFY